MTAILFDLDGTLTDPVVGITASLRHALIALGRPAPAPDDLTWCIGPPLQESLHILLGDEDPVDEAVALYRERYGTIGLFENTVYPGIEEVLSGLHGEGRRLFVATSKLAVYARRILEHFALDGYFETIYGAELNGTRSDKSALIAWILQCEGLAAESVVMVGDRSHDMVGARNNRVATVGVLYGYGTRAELDAAGADALAEWPDDLPALLS